MKRLSEDPISYSKLVTDASPQSRPLLQFLQDSTCALKANLARGEYHPRGGSPKDPESPPICASRPNGIPERAATGSPLAQRTQFTSHLVEDLGFGRARKVSKITQDSLENLIPIQTIPALLHDICAVPVDTVLREDFRAIQELIMPGHLYPVPPVLDPFYAFIERPNPRDAFLAQ
jgi:hypothetical protein